MLAQLEEQFLSADLADARRLLEDSHRQGDPIAEYFFDQRVKRLEGALDLESSPLESRAAGLALVFGGRPVLGGRGIKAAFGSQAIACVQKLVSQRYAASELGPLSARGRVPMSDDTHLMVTDVVRGSFGFVLQAMAVDSGQPLLRQAIDEVADTLSRMAASDDAIFDEASAEVDGRQLGTLKEFFKLLDDEGASVRVVEGERDFELTMPAIQRARERVDSIRIDERQELVEGEVIGWAEYSSRFELRRHLDKAVVVGAVRRDVVESLPGTLVNPLHRHVRAALRVREVTARSRAPRTTWTLLSLESIDAPHDWLPRPIQQRL